MQLIYFRFFDVLFLARPSVCFSIRLSVRCCGHSNLVIFNMISSKFYIWIVSIKLSTKFKYGFCLTNDIQDGRQNGRRLSNVVVTLTWSFLIGFLPNFKYGLLPSNSHRSLNMGFVGRMITKTADKTAAAYQFACCGHSNLVILQSSYIDSLPSHSRPSSNMGFVRRTIIKMAHKMPAAYQFPCCGHSNLVIFNRIYSNFHIWIASNKFSPKFEYGFCPTNDYQDGRQKGRRLSVCTCGHYTFVIY